MMADAFSIVLFTLFLCLLLSSVADPDPVGSGLFGSTGSGSGSGKIPDPDPLSTNKFIVV